MPVINSTCSDAKEYIVEANSVSEATKMLLKEALCERCNTVFDWYDPKNKVIDTVYAKVPSNCITTDDGNINIGGGDDFALDEIEVQHVARIEATDEMMKKADSQSGGSFPPYFYNPYMYSAARDGIILPWHAYPTPFILFPRVSKEHKFEFEVDGKVGVDKDKIKKLVSQAINKFTKRPNNLRLIRNKVEQKDSAPDQAADQAEAEAKAKVPVFKVEFTIAESKIRWFLWNTHRHLDKDDFKNKVKQELEILIAAA